MGLALTVILGILFTACQAYEYMHAGFGFASHIYGSTFFMATGFHGFHVIIGTIFLTVFLFRAMRGEFTPKRHFGFEAAAWYWHFVDVVWLFLFTCIYVWGAGSDYRDSDRLTATASACLVRIVKHESGGKPVGTIVHLGAEQKQDSFRFDEDLHALVFDGLIARPRASAYSIVYSMPAQPPFFTPTRSPVTSDGLPTMICLMRSAAASLRLITLGLARPAMPYPLAGANMCALGGGMQVWRRCAMRRLRGGLKP